jgi:hypothetical protein
MGGAGMGGAGMGGGGSGGGCTVSTPCTTSDAKSGVCNASSSCVPCATDPECVVYTGPHVCVMGSCTPGNCHTDPDCTVPGEYCGVTTPNTCGPCDAPAGNTIYVDPAQGNDATTGSGLAGGAASAHCAVKTLAQALTLAATTGGSIVLIGAGPMANAADTVFPLVIPANLTVSAKDPAQPLVFKVPAGALGFSLTAGTMGGTDGASLSGVVIDGGGTSGNLVTLVAGMGGHATLSGLTVKNGGSIGVHVVTGTTATLGAGVVISANKNDGVFVEGGTAELVTLANDAPISITGNANGISVTGTGALNVTGTPNATANGTGTVVIGSNKLSGIDLAATTGPSSISGLVLFKNTQHGAHITQGASIKLRGSQILQNSQQGICVGDTCDMNAPAMGDVAAIDLGTAADAGNNVFANNTKVGLCLAFAPMAGSLSAAGNTFGNTVCTAMMPKLGYDATCHGKKEVGSPMKNDIDLTTCSPM